MPKLAKLSPNAPLRNARHEAFAQAIADGAKLAEAYKVAGMGGKPENLTQLGYHLRRRPEVAARVQAVLMERVNAGTRRFARRQKGSGDLLARVVKELEDIAFQDIREVVDWRREAVTNDAGEVVDVREVVQLRDSAKLSPAAAKAVRGVILKAGRVQVDMHDKRAALETLAKILKGDDVATSQTTTNIQVNVGAAGAVDAVQRIAFLLASATARAPAAPVIEGAAVPVSRDVDAPEKP